MTTHDFQDGQGPVPAHRHRNGGGWVADTASVDETSFVGFDAQFDEARVFGEAQVYGVEDLDDEPTQRPETLEDWPGQLRKSSILLLSTGLLVALVPFLLVLVWLTQ